MSNTNNPSAFPSTNHGMIISTGMGLRDYFAAKAMQGDLIAGVHPDDFNTCAHRAYLVADAMLKAREQ
jgi:hypothetical protein